MLLLLACSSTSGPDTSATDSGASDTVSCQAGVEVGECPADVTLVDRDDVATSLLGLRGAVTVISSEAGWCESCYQQAVDLQDLYEARSADGLAMVTVLVESTSFEPADADDTGEWIDYFGLTHPVLADPEGVFLPAYGGDISNAPFVFYVLDGDGAVTWRALQDEADIVDQIGAAVDEILGG